MCEFSHLYGLHAGPLLAFPFYRVAKRQLSQPEATMLPARAALRYAPALRRRLSLSPVPDSVNPSDRPNSKTSEYEKIQFTQEVVCPTLRLRAVQQRACVRKRL